MNPIYLVMEKSSINLMLNDYNDDVIALCCISISANCSFYKG
jgi:hypothetical protein